MWGTRPSSGAQIQNYFRLARGDCFELRFTLVGVLKTGILNPAINSLLSRIRHTNTLVISDRGFPFWPQIETVDISLVDDIPRVLDVLQALTRNFVIAQVCHG